MFVTDRVGEILEVSNSRTGNGLFNWRTTKSLENRIVLEITLSKVIRMRSRLESVDYLTFDQRYPIIFHESITWHIYVSVINGIRQKFLITGLRARLKSVRSQCQRCKIDRARPEALRLQIYPVLEQLLIFVHFHTWLWTILSH